MNQRYQLSLKLNNSNNSGIGTHFIWRCDCYANDLDMEQSIKFVTCPVHIYQIYTSEIYWSFDLFQVI